ncbi:MAG TPA: ATP-binding protein [Anaerolineales bacterium]|nr:ATP-binding protein [Anaerolineales bacterium]
MKRKKTLPPHSKKKEMIGIQVFDQILRTAPASLRRPILAAAHQLLGALQQSEVRFQSVFENTVRGMALLNSTGEIMESNLALHNILGYSGEELKGKTLIPYIHPGDAELDPTLNQALSAHEAGDYEDEKRFVRKDGQVRWGRWIVSHVYLEHGQNPAFALAMLEDITERKKDQQFLVQSESLSIVGRLGASLAHEINNPLQAALGCLGLAEEALEEGADVRRYLAIAMEELERAAGIVSRLRNLTRTPKEKKKQPVDLNALIEQSLVLIRKRCQDQAIEVKWRRKSDLSPVSIVADNNRQVFLNLMLNAVEAMPDGGQLKISTISTGRPRGVRVTISDTGKGIEPDSLSNIFEPFYTTRPDGMGLGLYISKKIVEDQGGRLEVESRIGKGSKFSVWLPG